jgi:CHAD domain-containing protein
MKPTDLPPIVDQPIEPSWPLDVVAQVLVLRQLRAIEVHQEVALLDQNVEGVHKLRVACRRVTAIFDTMGKVWRPKQLKRMRKVVSGLRKQVGNARDLDVEVQRQCARVDEVRDEEEQAVRWLWRRAVSARRHEQKPVVSALQGFQSDGWPERLVKFFSRTPVDLWQLKAPGELLTSGPTTAKALPKLIRRQVGAVWGLSKHLDDPLRVVELHSMRLEAKTLRYVLEFFSDCMDSRKSRKLIKTFRRCQNLLGDVHDCDVQAEQMIALLADHAKLLRRNMRRVSETGAAHVELVELAHRAARASHDLPAEGLALCLAGLARRREALHAGLLVFWEQLTQEDLRAGLLAAAVRDDG